MRVKIHHHISKHNCDTCGGTWHDIYTVKGSLGKFESGDGAYCFGTEDGSFTDVVDFIIQELGKKVPIKLPDFELHSKLDNSIDWNDFYERSGSDNLTDEMKQFKVLDREIDLFYGEGWRNLLKENGVHLKESFSEDDDEDFWDYGDGGYDE